MLSVADTLSALSATAASSHSALVVINVPLHDAVPQRAVPDWQYGTAELGAAVPATKGAAVEPLGATQGVGAGAVEPRFGTAEGESAVQAEHSGDEVLKEPPAGSVLNQTALVVVNT